MTPIALSLISRGLMPVFPPKKVKGSRQVAAILKEVTAMQKSGGIK
jgi:hypothetical protein